VTVEGGPPVTRDFRSLDFEALWAGRGSTTAVERALLAGLLGTTDGRRALEVGPGEGRMTPVVRGRAEEYVALDLHREFLARIPWDPGPEHSLRVVADAHHAPFVDGAFSLVVIIRVYNFLPDPRAFLREIYRLLTPGGSLILGYQPRTSLATLVDDYRLFLSGRRARGALSMTFSRQPQVPSGPAPFPTWLPSRAFVRSTLATAGFDVVRSISSGAEDYVVGRRLPPRLFVQLAPLGDRLGFLPTQFVLARRPSTPELRPFPEWSDMVACARCRTTLGPITLTSTSRYQCVACGAVTQVRDGWLEAPPPVESGPGVPQAVEHRPTATREQ
jgi:SAM-dependent methyltransferase